MRRKNKGAAVLAMIMAVSMAGTSAVYAEETVPAKTVSAGEEKAESEDNEPAPCREDGHELTEFKVIPPTCTEKGYSIYKCKTDGCGYEERRDETAPLGHDMKEVSIQAATADKPGVITYKCQRTGCDYTELSEIPYKDSEKDGDNTSEPEDDPNKRPETDSAEDGKNEKSDESDSEKNPDTENSNPAEDKEATSTDESSASDTEDLPDEDIDEEYAAYASSTSTDIVTEYDPETAVRTISITKKSADNKEETEEVTGMTVPSGTTKIRKNADGNITDLAVSTAIKEAKNGFSLESENKKLHSISIIDENNPENLWITLNAKETASELGIRLRTGDNKLLVTLTENKKPLYITDVTDTEKEVILTTSTGGTCVINKNVRQISVAKTGKIMVKKNQIILKNVNGNKLEMELSYVKDTDRTDPVKDKISEGISENETEEKKNSDEELYWIQPYDDEAQDPIVITVYKK